MTEIQVKVIQGKMETALMYEIRENMSKSCQVHRILELFHSVLMELDLLDAYHAEHERGKK